jgi:hypothetical protein
LAEALRARLVRSLEWLNAPSSANQIDAVSALRGVLGARRAVVAARLVLGIRLDDGARGRTKKAALLARRARAHFTQTSLGAAGGGPNVQHWYLA